MPARRGFRWPWRRFGDVAHAVDEELEFHLATRASELERDGHSAGEARRRAEAEFGDVEGTRRYCTRTDWEGERAMRRTEIFTELWHDLAASGRTLRHRPGFTLAVVTPLALGIGATAAMFALIRAVLVAPLPYRAPDELVAIEQFMPTNPVMTIGAMSPPNYLDVRTSIGALAGAGAYYENEVTLTGVGAPVRLTAPAVTPSLLATLGVPARLGRTFAEGEGEPGRATVAVLSSALWARRFGRDSTVLGRTIRLDGEAYTVIGVMPPDFTFPVSGANLWIPLGWSASISSQRGAQYLGVIGRIARGADRGRLAAQLSVLSGRLTAAYPDNKDYLGLRAEPYANVILGNTRKPLILLGAAAILLVLIASANVTNLLLTQVNARATELAVRAALGAGRGRLARQVLTESVTLGLIGGIIGAGLAILGLAGFLRAWPGLLPRQETAGLGLTIPAVALIGSILVGLIVGLGPARRAATGSLANRLRAGKQTATGSELRLRRLLVAAELGLATVLLSGAVLLINSIGRLRQIDPGFRPEQVLTFRTLLPSVSYPTGDAIAQFYLETLDRLRAMPGVSSAGATMSLPLGGGGFGGTFTGLPAPEAGRPEDFRAQVRVVTRDYFEAMGIPIRQGRVFEPGDRRGGSPVLVVSQGLSNRFWPTTGAVGKTLTLGVSPGSDRVGGLIVGIVGDVRAAGLHRDPPAMIYAVLPQVTTSEMTFVVRTKQAPGPLIGAARRLVEARDRDIVVDQVTTLPDVVTNSLGRPRFIAELLTVFAILAVVLAGIGIYGVVSYGVAQRTREIGVRLALGADQARVTRAVVLQEIRWAIAGLAAGSAGTLIARPLLSSAVFGLNPSAPAIQLIATAGLLLVALAACFVPARRAASVSPLTAIRAE